MSGRFGSNTAEVERFIERLYHLRANQWEQVRKAMPRFRPAKETAYASAVTALQSLVGGGQTSGKADQDWDHVTPGPRPEQQNVHRAVVHCRVTCTHAIRLPEEDPAVVAAVNAAAALAAKEWIGKPQDFAALFHPFVEVIPLKTLG